MRSVQFVGSEFADFLLKLLCVCNRTCACAIMYHYVWHCVALCGIISARECSRAFFRRNSVAAAMSPLFSTSAFLQSIMPAPVASRSDLTVFASTSTGRAGCRSRVGMAIFNLTQAAVAAIAGPRQKAGIALRMGAHGGVSAHAAGATGREPGRWGAAGQSGEALTGEDRAASAEARSAAWARDERVRGQVVALDAEEEEERHDSAAKTRRGCDKRKAPVRTRTTRRACPRCAKAACRRGEAFPVGHAARLPRRAESEIGAQYSFVTL